MPRCLLSSRGKVRGALPMRARQTRRTIRSMQAALHLRVSIEMQSASASHPSESALSRLTLENPDTALVAVVLEVRREPPAGRVQVGSTEWHFGNRVELLEAIDAAYEQAIRPDLDS